MSDIDNKPEQPGLDKAAIETQARAAAHAEAREVVNYARSHKVAADDVIGLSMAEAKEVILAKHAERLKSEHKAPENKVVTVQRDSADKFIEHATENFSRYSAEDLIRRCFSFDGKRHEDMSKSDLAQRAVAGLFYSRDAANKTNASFPVLLGNIANKQLLSGFDSFSPVWNQFCTVKDAADFKEHNHVAVATGRMVETAENEAFPELNQKEGSYNSSLKLWGATVSVTYQALVNDELAEIMRSFRQAGYIAARTIERRVFQALLAATWTNDTTASATLATAGNIDKVRSGLKSKLSPAGEKMENDARIIIVDPANRYNAEVATGQLYGVSSGGNAMGGSNYGRGIQVVDSTFVSDTSLAGGALTTDYYLVNDPNIVDTVVVEFLRGQRAPQIAEFDAGAVAASKYKIMLPFQATIATHTDSAGNARVTGIQKATVA